MLAVLSKKQIMAATESNMLPLGTKAPQFSLIEPLTGKIRTLGELRSAKGTLVMFICNHCPFVKHVNSQLVALANDYLKKGISIVAISSNDAQSYPEDAPEKMAAIAKELEYPFPYLYDETQEVAKAYDAACTPDFYIFDGDLRLAYRGQLDSSRPSNNLPTNGEDIRNALESLLNNSPISEHQKPSIGCSIKWK